MKTFIAIVVVVVALIGYMFYSMAKDIPAVQTDEEYCAQHVGEVSARCVLQ